MGISPIGFQPYIYNTNSISPSSMNRVKPLEEDVTKAPGTDYSALYSDSLNENPLKRGETKNFADILDSQMAMSRQNAARVMAPQGEEAFE
ncbi:MAG: hypothetical protein K6F53_03290 [Lachnospiraceae bacterium]|nr:hypothetical protein [Lachnospiraceae bacterium]